MFLKKIEKYIEKLQRIGCILCDCFCRKSTVLPHIFGV